MLDSNLLSQAISLHQKGELGKANKIYSSILFTNPNHLQALCLSGSIAQACGDFALAIALFTKANQISPTLPSVYLQLGICHSNINELEIANDLYKKASLLMPNLIDPIINQANNLIKLSQFSEAFHLYQKALSLTPTSALVHNNIGTLFLKSMRPEDAKIWFWKALELQEDYASAWNSLGVALTELGDLERALNAYSKAIEYDSTFVEPLFNSHTVLIDLKRPHEALEALEKVNSLDPRNSTNLFFMGMMQEYSGDRELGSQILEALSQKGDALSEIESWHYLKNLDLKKATLVGSNTKTIELALQEAKLDGLVLEFGVYNGKSIRNIAYLTNSVVHGFDSFKGIPENWNDEPGGSYSANGTLPEVPNNVTLHEGWFEKTIPKFKNENIGPIRFINIDCDLYSSTKTIFDLLGSQITRGTVIVFDEYIGYKSWKEDEFKAFQEAVIQYQWQYEILTFSFATKQVAVKII